MNKKLGVIVVVVIALVVGIVGGYFLKGNKPSSSAVLPDGEYSVNAAWNWKHLSVKGNKITLDSARNYEVLSQNTENGIIVINTIGSKNKSTQIYKIIKTGNQYKWHVVAKGMTANKAVATATKK